MTLTDSTPAQPEKGHSARKARHAGDLLIIAPSVTPKMTNNEVSKLFHERNDVTGLAVVEDEVPIGLINRNVFMEGFAKPFARDVFGRKSCIAYMDKSPLIVDISLPVEELSAAVVSYGEKVLKDGYIMIDQNRYCGIGTGFDLLNTLSQMQAAKNHIIMESINYASVIQRSFMRQSDDDLAASLNDYFLWWEPRDVVGGDCYFIRRYENEGLFIALIDCTGHGVPGAFMTLIVMSALESALETMPPNDPAALMQDVNVRVKANLSQDSAHMTRANEAPSHSDDGFDGGFIWLSKKQHQIVYAGAKTALQVFHVGAAGVETVDGDRMGVGYTTTPENHVWHNQVFDVPPGTRLYITTDGIIDQIGGPKHIAFGKKRMREIIRLVGYEPMSKQMAILQEKLREYQSGNTRRDDVTVMGFRVE